MKDSVHLFSYSASSVATITQMKLKEVSICTQFNNNYIADVSAFPAVSQQSWTWINNSWQGWSRWRFRTTPNMNFLRFRWNFWQKIFIPELVSIVSSQKSLRFRPDWHHIHTNLFFCWDFFQKRNIIVEHNERNRKQIFISNYYKRLHLISEWRHNVYDFLTKHWRSLEYKAFITKNQEKPKQ